MTWRQKHYPGIAALTWTANYGSETANHYNHVHIATDDGGYQPGTKAIASVHEPLPSE